MLTPRRGGATVRHQTGRRQMTQKQIQEWIGYWTRANMVAFDQIQAFEHVAVARRFCQCMRIGCFNPDAVTDLQIWRALCNLRDPSKFAEMSRVA
jgi:hypothetical protein